MYTALPTYIYLNHVRTVRRGCFFVCLFLVVFCCCLFICFCLFCFLQYCFFPSDSVEMCPHVYSGKTKFFRYTSIETFLNTEWLIGYFVFILDFLFWEGRESLFWWNERIFLHLNGFLHGKKKGLKSKLCALFWNAQACYFECLKTWLLEYIVFFIFYYYYFLFWSKSVWRHFCEIRIDMI